MKLGVCGGPDIARIASKSGYDYFEMTVGALLKPLEEESAFKESFATIQDIPIPCQAVNVFVPPQLKITGEDSNLNALRRYASTVCQRAEQVGIKIIVFGSGGARQIPAGFPRAKAWEQIVGFCKMLGPIVEDHGITIAIEPLNRAECNVINSVGEGAMLVREIGHPSIRLLADAFHWAKDADSLDELKSNVPLLVHTHIATNPNRLAPGMEPYDLSPFLSALKDGGYEGGISLECQLNQPQTELPVAHELLKKYL
jgi:sugar phosphate isomerase/epimerase